MTNYAVYVYPIVVVIGLKSTGKRFDHFFEIHTNDPFTTQHEGI